MWKASRYARSGPFHTHTNVQRCFYLTSQIPSTHAPRSKTPSREVLKKAAPGKLTLSIAWLIKITSNYNQREHYNLLLKFNHMNNAQGWWLYPQKGDSHTHFTGALSFQAENTQQFDPKEHDKVILRLPFLFCSLKRTTFENNKDPSCTKNVTILSEC